MKKKCGEWKQGEIMNGKEQNLGSAQGFSAV